MKLKHLIAGLAVTIFVLAAMFAPPPVRLLNRVVEAQQNLNFRMIGMNSGADICQNPTINKSSLSIAISTATTTQLVALASGETIYVCNVTLTAGGTAPTIKFETGSSTTCSTPTVLTGTFAPAVGGILKIEGAGVQLQSASGKALCAVTADSGTPSFQGYMVYVQQ